MLNLTEVMPGGWPDSDTLRSRDCVTGDSFLEDYIIMLIIMLIMEKINMTMILHNLRVFYHSNDIDENIASSFVRLRFIAECGTKAPGVLNGYTDLMMIMMMMMMIVMTMMMVVTQLIPTMTKNHHGGNLSVMNMVGICR